MEQILNAAASSGLSEAALGVLAAMARLDGPDRTAVLRAHGLALGPRLWRVQDGGGLPALTALVPERERDAVYASDAWAIYRPQARLTAYILQAPGLATLSATLGGLALAKIGTTAAETVERRVASLSSIEYGAWHRGDRRYERADGFGAFGPAPRLQLAQQHPRSPVRLGLYGPEVGLPAGLSPGRFEVELNARLLPLRLQTVAGTAMGRDLCARGGTDTSVLMRFYRRGGGFSAASELTLLRPQADGAALAKLCADIVIDHVLGLLPQRSGRRASGVPPVQMVA